MCLSQRVSDHKHCSMTSPILSPHEQIPSLTVLVAHEWRLREKGTLYRVSEN